jgi:hypothetical protein
MPNHFFTSAAILLLPGFQAVHADPPRLFSGGDGSSAKAAIIIHVKSETAGISAEHQWVQEHLGGGTFQGQELIVSGSRSYDRIEIITADGSSHTIYFDISAYFGKY